MILRVGSQTLELSLDAMMEANNRFSVLYRTERSPERRRDIIALLYQINLPLFKKWEIYDFSQKQDYSQEAFFFIARALEKFDPARGHFLAFLKKYFVEEAKRQYLNAQAKQQNIRDAVDAAPLPALQEEMADTLFWQEAQQLLGEDTWDIVHGCLFGGKTPTDVARERGHPIRTVNYKYNRALEVLRTHIAKRSLRAGAIPETLGEGDWLGFKKFARVMDITPRYLKDWMNPHRPASVCPTYIDPRDIQRIQGVRFRYLFTAERGLVFPRQIRKKA